jgi:hypothetical protein
MYIKNCTIIVYLFILFPIRSSSSFLFSFLPTTQIIQVFVFQTLFFNYVYNIYTVYNFIIYSIFYNPYIGPSSFSSLDLLKKEGSQFGKYNSILCSFLMFLLPF